MGHGHVTPNPDGSKARCGGPALCSKCAQELAQLQRIQATGQKIAEVIDEAHNQPLSPEVWEAQQVGLERLARQNQKLLQMLTAIVDEWSACPNDDGQYYPIASMRPAMEYLYPTTAHPGTPQNPSICLQEPPVVGSGGDSASGKKYRLAWRHTGSVVVGYGDWNSCRSLVEQEASMCQSQYEGMEHWVEESQP